MANLYDVNGNVIITEPGTATYTNPVITDELAADPCVVYDNGLFYVFTTSDHVRMYSSPDLVEFTDYELIVTDTDYAILCELTGNQTTHCWAPNVVKIGDMWYMYVSVVAGNTAANCHMCVFTAPEAKGPWKYRGEITNASSLGVNDCIDADVVRDTDGKLYMFIGSSYGIYLIRLSSDGLSMDSSFTKVLIHPHSPSGSNDTRLEGSFCFWRNGYYYLFCSAGMYTKTGGYHLVISRCKSLQGPFLNKDGNSIVESANSGTTILSGNTAFYSPGHNSNIIIDSNGDYWTVYHAYPSSETTRRLMIQKVLWDNNGWPYFENGTPINGGIAPVF